MKVTLHTVSPPPDKWPLRTAISPRARDGKHLGRNNLSPPVCLADGKHQLPLLKQSAIGRPQRIARVVNARGFQGGTVQFDDLIFFQHVSLPGKADVVTTEEKAGELTGDFVNPNAEFGSVKPHPVAKDSALHMINRLHQLELLASRQNFVAPRRETLSYLSAIDYARPSRSISSVKVLRPSPVMSGNIFSVMAKIRPRASRGKR